MPTRFPLPEGYLSLYKRSESSRSCIDNLQVTDNEAFILVHLDWDRHAQPRRFGRGCLTREVLRSMQEFTGVEGYLLSKTKDDWKPVFNQPLASGEYAFGAGAGEIPLGIHPDALVHVRLHGNTSQTLKGQPVLAGTSARVLLSVIHSRDQLHGYLRDSHGHSIPDRQKLAAGQYVFCPASGGDSVACPLQTAFTCDTWKGWHVALAAAAFVLFASMMTWCSRLMPD